MRLSYWSYWAVFFVAPVALVYLIGRYVGIAYEYLLIAVPVLFLLAAGPGEHIYRWWRHRVWKVRSPSKPLEPPTHKER